MTNMDDTNLSDDLSLKDVCGCRRDEEQGEDDIPCAPCLYDQSYLLRKACTLFTDNIASSMVHRHSRLLNEYLRVSKEGVLLRDLRFFIYALEFLCKGAESEPEYGDLLRSMLELGCLPPLMLLPEEGLSPMNELQELFNSLGFLIASLRDVELRMCAVQTAQCLLTRRQHAHQHSVPLNTLHAAVERSEMARVIGQFLEFAVPELYTALIDLALLLSSLSAKCSRDLANAGTIDFILLRLDPEYPMETSAEFKDPCETFSLDEVETSLLWGMLKGLQVIDDPPLSRRRPSSDALRCLSNCLHQAVQDGYVPGAISLMSLVLLALHLFPNLPIVESGLADDIATLSVASELKSEEKWTETFMLDRTRDAFELKRLLLLAICYLSQQDAAKEVLRKRRVIMGLLRLAEPNAVELSPWQPTLSTALTDLALHALIAISVTAPRDVVLCGGLSYFLLVIDSYLSSQADTEKLLACITAIYFISSIHDDNCFLQTLGDIGGFSIIVRFCCYTLNFPNIPFAQQNVLTKAFMVLKILLENEEIEKARQGSHLIQLLELFLKIVIPSNSSDELFPLDDKLIICALDFFWETVILCQPNCERIIKDGYVYKFLDLLQISIFPVQLILLGLLVDLIEFENCIAHVVTWRGNNNCAFLPLLMKIWRQEEQFISPHRDSHGCIAEVSLPLMGREQWLETYSEEKNYETSPAIIDMYASARPKIYAIIKLLTNRNKEITKEIEEFYHVHTVLQKKEEITMELADKYLEMKMKEVWNEIELDLNHSLITPTKADATMMKILKERLLQCVKEVQEQQQKLVQDIKHMELNDERILYNLVEESNAIEKTDTLRELESVACASDPFFMNKMKQIEQQQISTIFPLHIPLAQCFTSYSLDPLCKLILHQHYAARCRKDFETNNQDPT